MTVSSNYVQFCDFELSILHNSNIFINILNSFEFQKFWSHKVKAMAKRQKINFHSYLVENYDAQTVLINLLYLSPKGHQELISN